MTDSFLSRPPRIPPFNAVLFSVVCFSLALAVPRSTFQGGMIGGGVALLLTATWDFLRLRFVQWRDSRDKADDTEADSSNL